MALPSADAIAYATPGTSHAAACCRVRDMTQHNTVGVATEGASARAVGEMRCYIYRIGATCIACTALSM